MTPNKRVLYRCHKCHCKTFPPKPFKMYVECDNCLSLTSYLAARTVESWEEKEDTKFCNHHHDLTEKHQWVDFGDGEFVANVEAIPLLRALNEVGLRTRTHHVDDGENAFVSILLDNAEVEVRQVHERDASRDKYNGKYEVLISWYK